MHARLCPAHRSLIAMSGRYALVRSRKNSISGTPQAALPERSGAQSKACPERRLPGNRSRMGTCFLIPHSAKGWHRKIPHQPMSSRASYASRGTCSCPYRPHPLRDLNGNQLQQPARFVSLTQNSPSKQKPTCRDLSLYEIGTARPGQGYPAQDVSLNRPVFRAHGQTFPSEAEENTAGGPAK